MKNERLQNVPKLFPLSNYASRTVVENYFPTHNQKDGSPLFSKELTIMKKHYEPTQQMMMFLSEIMSTTSHLNRNALLIGMTFLHSAARIEAQTKRSILPLITPTQLVDYLGAPDFMEYEEGTDKITKGRTSIVIAHRLATIKKADSIIVMDSGNIVHHLP